MSLGPINSANNAYLNASNKPPLPVKNEMPPETDNTSLQVTSESETEPEIGDHAKSFLYGALGMDHPEQVNENENTAYTTGQVLKAIGTVGSIIAIIV